MPAIRPTQLKAQLAELSTYSDDPPRFIRRLEELLEFYADRTRRPAQAGAPAPIMRTYQIAAPILRGIHTTLLPLASAHPAAALALADALWEKPVLEHRQIAIRLLGAIPPHPPSEILERVRIWAAHAEEEQLLQMIFTQGVAQLLRSHPQPYLEVIGDWLEDADISTQQMGLLALSALAEDPTFENLPAIFTALTPLVRSPHPDLSPYLRSILHRLANRSPQETAHFLRQSLVFSEHLETTRLVRQVLPAFPEDLRLHLREALKSHQ